MSDLLRLVEELRVLTDLTEAATVRVGQVAALRQRDHKHLGVETMTALRALGSHVERLSVTIGVLARDGYEETAGDGYDAPASVPAFRLAPAPRRR